MLSFPEHIRTVLRPFASFGASTSSFAYIPEVLKSKLEYLQGSGAIQWKPIGGWDRRSFCWGSAKSGSGWRPRAAFALEEGLCSLSASSSAYGWVSSARLRYIYWCICNEGNLQRACLIDYVWYSSCTFESRCSNAYLKAWVSLLLAQYRSYCRILLFVWLYVEVLRAPVFAELCYGQHRCVLCTWRVGSGRALGAWRQ